MTTTNAATAGTTRLPDGVRATPRPAMLTYARLDLRRQLRDRMALFFIVGLPTFMYLVFGLGSDDRVGSGNVAMYIMISMACYGAVTATTGIAGSAATEQVHGVGPPARAHPHATAGLRGREGGAGDGRRRHAGRPDLRHRCRHRRPRRVERLGARRSHRVAGLGAVRGLRARGRAGLPRLQRARHRIGLHRRHGVPGRTLHADERDHARPRPAHAALRLCRAGPLPLTDGWLPVDGRDPLWLPVANVLAWTVIFSLLAMWGVRRSRART